MNQLPSEGWQVISPLRSYLFLICKMSGLGLISLPLFGVFLILPFSPPPFGLARALRDVGLDLASTLGCGVGLKPRSRLHPFYLTRARSWH